MNGLFSQGKNASLSSPRERGTRFRVDNDLRGTKKSEEPADEVRHFAGEHIHIPRLRDNLEETIRLMFDIAGKTLAAYDQYKREMGQRFENQCTRWTCFGMSRPPVLPASLRCEGKRV